MSGCLGLGSGFVARERSGSFDVGRINPESGKDAGEGRHWERGESWTDVGGSFGVAMGGAFGPAYSFTKSMADHWTMAREYFLDLVLGPVLVGVGWTGDGVEATDTTDQEYFYGGGFLRLGYFHRLDDFLAVHFAASYVSGGTCLTRGGDCGSPLGDSGGVRAEIGLNVYGYPLEWGGALVRLTGSYLSTLPGAPSPYSGVGLKGAFVLLF